jgi:hypothetical protein
LHTQLGWQKRQTVLDISLVMATTALLVSTAVVAAARGVLPFAIAQEEQASLGEQDSSLTDGIVSDVLDDDRNNVVVDQQHNTAEQDAANLVLQDEDTMQEQDAAQDAANRNVDSDVQIGEQVEPPTR